MDARNRKRVSRPARTRRGDTRAPIATGRVAA
ncbi:MAG: hypothetical protein QOE08_1527, partial [Thermoleophilaceae bacterium]|nr:hypothetical protein [Thermoleophilaceae bacterium]